MADDDFSDHVKRQILDAYGFASEAELDAATEEELPGYLAAEAEYEARREAYLTELPGRVQEATAKVTELLRAQGMLPDGIGFELVPMDLEADPKWMAQAPKWWVKGEPIVVNYATDRPFGSLVPLDPNAPVLTEERKRAAAEAASARIKQWQKQWETGVLGNPGRDQPRSHDYPAGG